jgi:hypothetical protein
VWVPQRADVDNFFGSAVEADLITVVQDRGKDPAALWLNPKSRRKHKPKLIHGERIIEHYFTPQDAKPVPGQITGPLVSDAGDCICNLTLKVSDSYFPKDVEHKMSLVVEHDYRAPVIASAIKAAHLTLFKILGYEYLFSPSGLFLADILRKFYERYKPPAKCTEEDVEDYFLDFENMVAPLLSNSYQGMIADNLLLSCFSANEAVFAIGVVVKAGTDAFCVMVPGMSAAIDTYFSFLKEPPQSIAARMTRFKPPDENGGGCWEIPPGEPMRIPLKQNFPEDERMNLAGISA